MTDTQNLTPEIFSTNEKKQYDRHLILEEIGTKGQEKLKKAKILVIGAGGLGCPILQYLAAAGVGTLGIVDNDVVSQSNLQRQVLYTHEDIGKSKAKTAANKLSKLNPYITFEVHQEMLSTHNAIYLFNQYDIIVDGSDNFPTRYLTNDAAIITNKPLVFGAIFKFEGQVSVFNYKNGPTYRCLYPTPPKPGDMPNCSEIGVLGVLPGIIGSLQANEVIKIILGLGTVLSGKLLSYNTLTHQQLLLQFSKTAEAQIKSLAENYALFCEITTDNFTTISLKKLSANKAKYNLLDVREDWERATYHIGGQHIPLAQIPKRFKEINSSKPLVVYCKAGTRSKKAITLLQQLHFQQQLIQLEGILETP